MGEPPLFDELAIYKAANARLIEAIERQQDQLTEAASTLQALAGENEKLRSALKGAPTFRRPTREGGE